MANNKLIAIIAAVIIVVAAIGVAAVSLNGGDKEEKREIVETGRLVIYGNANNDDYLDDYDVQFIQDILDSKTVWDSKKNPFADTDTNGKIEQNDIDLLKKFINKEKATMYYYANTDQVLSIPYPIDGNLAVNFSYGLDAAIVLGCYDRVTVVDTQTRGSDEKYPGLSSKANVGDPRNDAEALIKKVKEDNVQAVFGYSGNRIAKITENVEKGGASIAGIQLTLNHTEGHGCDKYGSILTLGIMLGCEERAYKFIDYVDKVTAYLDGKNAPAKTYVMPEYEEEAFGTASTTWIMTTDKDGTWSSGCNNSVEFLNLTDVYSKKFADGFIEIDLEDLESKNPDVILLCSWGVVDESMSQEQINAVLKGFFKQYEGCAAYERGDVYVLTYEAYGPVCGIAGVVLLGSYIWPDIYDEKTGWDLLQEYYDNFTMMKLDVKKVPTLSPFNLKDVQ